MRDHFYRQIPHRLLAGFYTELWLRGYGGKNICVMLNVNVKSEEKWWRIIGNRYFYVGLSRVLAKERLFKVIQCRCLITQWPTFTNRYFLWDLIDGSKYRKNICGMLKSGHSQELCPLTYLYPPYTHKLLELYNMKRQKHVRCTNTLYYYHVHCMTEDN